MNPRPVYSIDVLSGASKYPAVEEVLKAMFVFRKQGLRNVCKALGKRHANTNSTLQFTKTNYYDIIRNPNKFKKLGVDLFRFKF